MTASTVALLGTLLLAGAPAGTAVYRSCTTAGCATQLGLAPPGATELTDQPRLGRPANGQCNSAGGRFSNYQGQLHSGDIYYEYDVNPHGCSEQRDPVHIVVDFTTGTVSYSPTPTPQVCKL